MISVIQMPCFQCSLCRATSTYSPQLKSVCLVAGITKDCPLGSFTLISLRRHFGIVKLNIDLPRDIVVFSDVPLLVEKFVPDDVEDVVPELVEEEFPEDVDDVVPLDVELFVPEFVELLVPEEVED